MFDLKMKLRSRNRRVQTFDCRIVPIAALPLDLFAPHLSVLTDMIYDAGRIHELFQEAGRRDVSPKSERKIRCEVADSLRQRHTELIAD